MVEEDYEPTYVEYESEKEFPFVFTFFSEWAINLWERLLGRIATDEEEAIENKRYERVPRGDYGNAEE